MIELNDFYNDGFGWVCRACERKIAAQNETEQFSRLMREGEAESKNVRFSTSALAKWTDDSRETLICPRCGISEKVKSKK